jgi:hypothetical protein
MLRVSMAIARLAIAVAFVSAACAYVYAADVPAGKPNASKRASPLESAAFVSRELVDVEFQADQSLAILLSVPGTVAPGLYRWGLNDAQPQKLCDIHAPSFFSFDRNVVIERERGANSRVRLYSPSDCRLLATINVAGNVLDVDVRDRYLAAAVRLAEKQIALQLFSLDGQLLSSAGIGRNVEMGFAPDGAMLVNFDLSDVGLQAWRIPRLTNILLPHWLHDTNVTFVPGSRFVKRYQDDTLSIARWPIGTPVHTIHRRPVWGCARAGARHRGVAVDRFQRSCAHRARDGIDRQCRDVARLKACRVEPALAGQRTAGARPKKACATQHRKRGEGTRGRDGNGVRCRRCQLGARDASSGNGTCGKCRRIVRNARQ